MSLLIVSFMTGPTLGIPSKFSFLYQIDSMLNDGWTNPFDIGHGPSNGHSILSQNR